MRKLYTPYHNFQNNYLLPRKQHEFKPEVIFSASKTVMHCHKEFF